MAVVKTKTNYYPHIDGLRAIAVLGVLFFHANLGCSGGFVGVDVFFVISGFLITSIIVREQRAGKFSLLNFWSRRIRRILPALVATILGVLAIGYFGMFPHDYELLGKQIVSVVFCFSNIKFYRESGYFDTASTEKPLLHTWSLSVEEQFYFVLPLILIACFRVRRERMILPVMLFVWCASFYCSVYFGSRDPAAGFFLLWNRSWELATGSLLVFVRPVRSRVVRELMSGVGLFLIIGSFLCVPVGLDFSSLIVLPAVIGSSLVIWSGFGHHLGLPFFNNILSLRLFVSIGLISYSLYLWHWPIFAFQAYLGYSDQSSFVQLGLLLLSFLPALLCWRFVETPFRKHQVFPSQRAIIVGGGLGACFLVLLGLILIRTQGNCGRFSNSQMQTLHKSLESRVKSNFDDLNFGEDDVTTKFLGDGKGDIKFVVWGDSHARALGGAFSDNGRFHGVNGLLFAQNGGLPLLEISVGHKYLGSVNEKVKASILECKPEVVFLVSRWSKVVNNTVSVGKSHLSDMIPSEDSLRNFSDSLRKTVSEFRSQGIVVHLVGDVPRLSRSATTVWFGDFLNLPLRKSISRRSLDVTVDEYDGKQGQVNGVMSRVASSFDGVYFHSSKSIVFSGKDSVFSPYNDEATFYFDRSHLNDFGAEYLFGEFIRRALKSLK